MSTPATWASTRGCEPFDVEAAARRVPGCPARFLESFERYINSGLRPGDFVAAVLSNDLANAVGRADDKAMEHFRDIFQVAYDLLPMKSHGSREAVEAWLSRDRAA